MKSKKLQLIEAVDRLMEKNAHRYPKLVNQETLSDQAKEEIKKLEANIPARSVYWLSVVGKSGCLFLLCENRKEIETYLYYDQKSIEHTKESAKEYIEEFGLKLVGSANSVSLAQALGLCLTGEPCLDVRREK